MNKIKYNKVSFIGCVDYANCMTEYSNAINKYCVGHKSKVICKHTNKIDFVYKHDYDLQFYAESVDKWYLNEKSIIDANKWLKDSDHIIIGEEKGPNLSEIKDLGSWNPNCLQTVKEVCGDILNIDIINETKAGQNNNLHLFHAGTIYRSQPHIFNVIGTKYFNKIIHSVDLYRLSRKREQDLAIYASYEYNYTKINAEYIINKKFSEGIINIFHLPTNKIKKGTSIITSVLNELVSSLNQINREKNINVEYVLIAPDTYKPLKNMIDENKGWIPNNVIIKIKEMTHIYIDAFNPEIGYFGVSAVEALMTGNITFSTINNYTTEAKKAANKNITSNPCPVIHLGASPERIRSVLKGVLEKPLSELKELAIKGLEWYHQTSTHEAVAKKFEKELLE